MKFECPHCRQRLEAGPDFSGAQIHCPACNGAMLIPDLTGAPPPDLSQKNPLQQSLQASLDRGGRTLNQVMAEQQLDGGIELIEEPTLIDESGIIDATAPNRAMAQVVREALPGEEKSRYQVGDAVNLGGMGAILNARDLNLRRNVAMKVMLDPAGVRKDQVLRFIEEAQITGQLEHPGIVPVYELSVGADGQVYYTMKFVRGHTLRNILQGILDGNQKMIENYPLPRLLTIYQKICDAIAFAHSRRVIHRDLKPENVMVGDFGEVLVMDWGLAKVLPRKVVMRMRTRGARPAAASAAEGGPAMESMLSESGHREPLSEVESVRGDLGRTLSGAIMGTPGYMAPEQACGEIGKLDERADVYSLGAILYTLLTLRPPIQGEDLHELVEKIKTGNIPPPSTYNPKTTVRKQAQDGEVMFRAKVPGEIAAGTLAHLPEQRVPDSLAAVTMKALATEAVDRYQTVPELQKDIEAYQTGFATSAEAAGTWRQLRLLIQRHKAVFTAMALSLVVILLGSAAFLVKVMASERQAMEALASFRAEQAQRQAERKQSAPALVQSAKTFIEQGNRASATTLVDSALEYDPGLFEARLLKIILHMEAGDYAGAKAQSVRYLEAKDMEGHPGDRDGQALLRVAEVALKYGTTNALRGGLSTLLARHGMPNLAARYAQSMENLLPVFQDRVEKAWPGTGTALTDNKNGTLAFTIPTDCVGRVWNLLPLRGMPLASLNLGGSKVNELSSLTGMPLTLLDLNNMLVRDLGPLKGMSLTTLNLESTAVSDLSPLKGMPLTTLNLRTTPISDLTPLKGMPLATLDLRDTRVSDLMPLQGTDLTTLYFTPNRVTAGLEAIRNMKSLTYINEMPPADFWQKYDAGEFKGK